MSKQDGGAAFPRPYSYDDLNEFHASSERGLTLRDWFAGQTLAGIAGDPTAFNDRHGKDRNKAMAEWCFDQADAMLAEREKDRPA